MGQNTSHHANHGRLIAFTGNNTPPPNYDLPPLKFHSTHGDNIVIAPDGFTATRHDSFCKGIVFSNRPIMIAERVCIRLANMSGRWSGVLRIGFSAHDPSNLSHLPKYACPDLTSKPGYWAKALGERYAMQGNVIHYYVAGNGDVHFGLGGKDLGVFFTGIDTRQPLWAMVDLYGNCTTLEMVDVRSNLNNFSNGSSSSSTRAPSRNGGVRPPQQQQQQQQQQILPPPSPVPYHQQAQLHSPIQVILPPLQPSQAPRVSNLPSRTSLENQIGAINLNSSTNSNTSNLITGDGLPPLRYNRGVTFRPMTFHRSVGRHVRLELSSTIGRRHEEEFAQGYVFSSHNVTLGDRIVLQVLGTEDGYIGSIAFGLTNCDPSSIDVQNLPEDSDLLLDRAEYWVVSKDVASCPSVGDELSFQINRDGSVEFSKNGNIPSVFMHVDTSLPLWAFWDIYGHTLKIRLIGSTTEPVPRFEQATNYQPSVNSSTLNSPDSGIEPSMQQHQPLSECTICFEKGVDCVLYTCGHMCMCYECALQQWKGRGGGFCPMCRHVIRDVIKTFRS